jgi:hypothetical protein
MIFDEEEQTARDDLAHAVKTEKPKGTRIEKLRWIVQHQQAARVDGAYVDMLTANVCVKVYNALNETNRVKFVALTMRKMGLVAWKLAS